MLYSLTRARADPRATKLRFVPAPSRSVLSVARRGPGLRGAFVFADGSWDAVVSRLDEIYLYRSRYWRERHVLRIEPRQLTTCARSARTAHGWRRMPHAGERRAFAISCDFIRVGCVT